jgi:hypothetical protein
MFKYNPEFHLAFGKVEPREMDVRLRVQSRQLGNTRVGREGGFEAQNVRKPRGGGGGEVAGPFLVPGE